MTETVRPEEVPPGSARMVSVDGNEVALFNVEGRLYAVGNRCPHRSGPLFKGKVEPAPETGAPAIRCPLHGWLFDLKSGACLTRPGARIPTYDVQRGQALLYNPLIAHGSKNARPLAILLAAGIGKRMGPDAGPKCLLQVGGRSLLRRTLEDLRAAGVREVVLVAGFRKEEVMEEARRCAGALRLGIVENERYREGAILSLWSARAFLDRPVLVMDADVLCPPSVLERLVGSLHSSCILVDGSSPDTGEEQMVFGQAGRVLQIAKRPPEEIRRTLTRFGESIGFLRVSQEGALLLRELLEEKVQGGQTGIEHEQVYPDLFRKIPVGCERLDGLAWTEIDTPQDLERAEKEIFPRWQAPLCLNRVMSNRFLPWVLRQPLTPNQWTLISFLLGLASVACIAQGTRPMDGLGALLFQFYYIVDNWDGEVARAKGLSSRWGGWFDVTVDLVIQVGLVLALAEGLMRSGVPWWVVGLGPIAAVGIALDFLATFWAKVRGFGPAVFGDPARGLTVPSDSPRVRWLRANLTNENFSLLVAAVLLLGLRLPFLAAMAVGCQIYWIRFLLRERRRLMGW